jgi:peptide chain release factor 1
MPGSPPIPDALFKRLDDLDARLAALDARLGNPAVLADHQAVRDLTIQRAAIAPVVEDYRRYRSLLAEADALEGERDPELADLAREEIPRLRARAASLMAQVKARLVTSEDRQVASVMLEVRAGTGGDEAALWARDLLDMYARFAARRGWSFELLDLVPETGAGGVRSAVANVRGEGVWAELAFEAGVHSVKRVPATESQGRIHTSTATVAVLPEPEPTDVRIDWSRDVVEHVTTSQGPGGQNVNKVATAVHLRHAPTGIEVRMQETKSQQQNRAKARRLLAARVAEHERRRLEAERSAARRGQIRAGERSEKIRVYRFQDRIVADERLQEKFRLDDVLLAGDLTPITSRLLEIETAQRLEAL